MTKTFSSADNGSTIALDAEERFTLVLAENPTTGDRRHVRLSAPAIVVGEGRTSRPRPKHQVRRANAICPFALPSAGAFALVCHRYREGELSSAAQETFRLTRTVR